MYPIGAAGVVLAFLKAGWRGGLGFLIGALISAWNYGRLEAIANAITRQYAEDGAPKRKLGPAAVALTLLRYGAIVGVLYVIVKYFEVNVMAALIGLFTGLIAVFADSLLTQFGKS